MKIGQLKYWWVYYLLAVVLLFINPFFGAFSVALCIVFITYIGTFSIFWGHSKLVQKNKLRLAIFKKEFYFFAFSSVFFSIFSIGVIGIMGVENYNIRKTFSPIHIQFLLNFPMISDALSIASICCIVFSGYTYIKYIYTIKEKVLRKYEDNIK